MVKSFNKENIYLASGFAHPQLAQDVADYLDVELGGVEQRLHPNGEIYSRFSDSVRGKHAFIIQSHVPSKVDGRKVTPNDAIIQQAHLIDAARSSSASEITAVSPYLAYMRQDRKTRGRETTGARPLIQLLGQCGARRIVTVDIHSPQSMLIHDGPFDHLTAQRALEAAMVSELGDFDQNEVIVVAPDAGAAKLAQSHQRHLDVGILHLAKQRARGDSQKIQRDEKVPEAEGKICLVFDDMIDTAGTLVTAVEALRNSGAKAIHVGASHGIFSNPALARLEDAQIDKLYVTDTFPQKYAKRRLGDKLQVVSIAPIIGEAIRQIATDGSISSLFDDENHM